MEKKFAYQCDNHGLFIGETPRQHSPEEPGVWLVPGGATLVAPPAIPAGQRARFNWVSQTWSLEPIPAPPAPPKEPSNPLPPAPEPGTPAHETMLKIKAAAAAEKEAKVAAAEKEAKAAEAAPKKQK